MGDDLQSSGVTAPVTSSAPLWPLLVTWSFLLPPHVPSLYMLPLLGLLGGVWGACLYYYASLVSCVNGACASLTDPCPQSSSGCALSALRCSSVLPNSALTAVAVPLPPTHCPPTLIALCGSMQMILISSSV